MNIVFEGLEIHSKGARGVRGLREAETAKAWTHQPETFVLRMRMTDPSLDPATLRVRLCIQGLEFSGDLRGSERPDTDFETCWELPMTPAEESDGALAFSATLTCWYPALYTLNAAAGAWAGGRWLTNATLFAADREARLIVHPRWAKGARMFEAYTRYFGATRDAEGNVRLGTLQNLAEQVPRLAHLGFDALWAMGVLRRGRRHTKGIGSPYAIYSHRQVDRDVGDVDDLHALRQATKSRNVRLGLDFVGNHTSWDSPLLGSHPDWYQATPLAEGDSGSAPPGHRLVRAKGRTWLVRQGHSRYDEWEDVAQLDWNAPGLRDHMKREILHLIRTYDLDFLRCDMAMLMQKSVHYYEHDQDVWEERWPGMDGEWWREVIVAAMKQKPEVVFVAEVYWGNDQRLQELGFALTYDHGFYHHLTEKKWGKDILSYLQGQEAWLPPGAATLHYIENHDELRSESTTDRLRVVSALCNLFTERGAVLVYNGQMEGEWAKPSIDAPWHDAPSPGIDALKWQVHEELLFLGRRYPALRTGETLDLLQDADSPYRALVRLEGPQAFVLVAVNQATDAARLSVTLRLPARLGIEDHPQAVYRLTAHLITPDPAGEDAVVFDRSELLCSAAEILQRGVEVALPGNSGYVCAFERVAGTEAPAPVAEVAADHDLLATDVARCVRLEPGDVVFDEFLVFKHEMLQRVLSAMQSDRSELRTLAMRLLVAYSGALAAFPACCAMEVEARSDGALRLSLPRGADRCVLCLPDRIAPAVAGCRDATIQVGAPRHGLIPLYLEVQGPEPSVTVTVEAAEAGTDHRSHLLFRNRELARVHGLTMHLREPVGEAVYFEPGQTVALSVQLGDSLADNHRLELFALTDVTGEDCSLRLEPEPDGAGLGARLEARVLGWHPLDLLLVDRWTEVTRRERRLHLDVVAPWTVGLNGYTLWLRHVRRPGKDPEAPADFADLRWAVRHARDLGFQVVLLLPITDPVGRSPYDQLSTMALDPGYLVPEDFLRDASAYLEGGDVAYEAFASQDWVCEYVQAKAHRVVRYGYPDLLPGGRFHDLWIRFLEAEAGALRSPFSFEPYRRLGRRTLQATAVHRALVRFLAVQQYFAHEQLRAAVADAHALGMRLLFDQPLYPSSYSAERTFHPERFQRARWILSPDGSQRWSFARYDWDYERTRDYADYIRPLAYFVEEMGFDGFRWDAIHTVYLDGQEELLKTVAERFTAKAVLRLGEQLGADEQLVNPVLHRYGYTLYLVPWWYPGHAVSDTVEKLEERLMLADRGHWWLASSLHDHPRISEWFRPLVEGYGRLPGRYAERMVGQVLAVFAFFPNFVIFCGDEYASGRRVNVPGDAANTWDAPPPWAEGEAQADLTDLVSRLNRIRSEHVALRRPGGRRMLHCDAKARGLLSLGLVSDQGSFILLASFSPKYLCGWVEAPFAAMGIDPKAPLSLTDLLTGDSLAFVPDESLLADEQALWVHLRFGEPRLLHVPPQCDSGTS